MSADVFETIRADAHALLDAAAASWDRNVPYCPAWDQAELVRHTGGVFHWMETVVRSGERASRRALTPGPADPALLAEWFRGHVDETIRTLSNADPETSVWTFSTRDDQRVGWWIRRLSAEVAIHRWDAQRAEAPTTQPAPIDSAVAAAGIEEFLTEFLPGLLAPAEVAGLHGTLHLHATDEPLEWFVDLDDPTGAIAEHRRADTAVRATRSDLLLWLSSRHPEALDVLGAESVVPAWAQLRR